MILRTKCLLRCTAALIAIALSATLQTDAAAQSTLMTGDANTCTSGSSPHLPEATNDPFVERGLADRVSFEDANTELGLPQIPAWSPVIAPAPNTFHEPSLWQRITSDHKNYYSWSSIRLLSGGFLVGAAVANTQLDREIQDHFQSSVRHATTDEWFEFFHANKELGNGYYTLPVFAGAWVLGSIYDESPALATASKWGERSLRAFLVGAPPLILAQKMTGGSRPGEHGEDSSHWHFWADNNGVSGHAFMSSLPFLNAAKMADNAFLRTTCYAGSLLGPLSRVNDNDHYPSQIALGWWMAYVATTAIDQTENAHRHWMVSPYVSANGYGAILEYAY